MIPSMQQLSGDLIQVNQIWDVIRQWEVLPFVQMLTYFLIGLIITLIARWFVGQITARNISAHHSMLFRRITFYVGLALSLIVPLKASGIDVTALLGAAGILTAAVAFAAQTSISNFLSGVFLVAEKPFVIGDYVSVNDTLGEVLSIDLLSVKIRTKDNTLMRIPNETLLKSQFKNVTRFPIRRFDIKFRVFFDADLERINQILLEVAKKNPYCLVTPAPELSFVEFGESAIIMMFSAWGKQATYNQMQTELQHQIQQAFRNNDIRLPATNLALSPH